MLSTFKSKYSKLVDSMTLSRFQKDIIRDRYIHVVSKAESDYRRTTILFLLFTNLITVSGVLITAFVSFDKLNWIDQDTARIIFWVIWSLSIMLTLSNKWLYSFNIHKKYVLNIVILEKLYSEGWSYLAGIGKYKKCVDYDERFKLFCHRIEKIKMKSLESMPEMESSDFNDILATGTNAAPSTSDDDSTPPLRKSKHVRIGVIKSKPQVSALTTANNANSIADSAGDSNVVINIDDNNDNNIDNNNDNNNNDNIDNDNDNNNNIDSSPANAIKILKNTESESV